MGGVYTGVVYFCIWGVLLPVTQDANKVSHIDGGWLLNLLNIKGLNINGAQERT